MRWLITFYFASTQHQLNKLVSMRHNSLFAKLFLIFQCASQNPEFGLAPTVKMGYIRIRVPNRFWFGIRKSKTIYRYRICSYINHTLYTPNCLRFSEHIRKHRTHWVAPKASSYLKIREGNSKILFQTPTEYISQNTWWTNWTDIFTTESMLEEQYHQGVF